MAFVSFWVSQMASVISLWIFLSSCLTWASRSIFSALLFSVRVAFNCSTSDPALFYIVVRPVSILADTIAKSVSSLLLTLLKSASVSVLSSSIEVKTVDYVLSTPSNDVLMSCCKFSNSDLSACNSVLLAAALVLTVFYLICLTISVTFLVIGSSS